MQYALVNRLDVYSISIVCIRINVWKKRWVRGRIAKTACAVRHVMIPICTKRKDGYHDSAIQKVRK